MVGEEREKENLLSEEKKFFLFPFFLSSFLSILMRPDVSGDFSGNKYKKER